MPNSKSHSNSHSHPHSRSRSPDIATANAQRISSSRNSINSDQISSIENSPLIQSHSHSHGMENKSNNEINSDPAIYIPLNGSHQPDSTEVDESPEAWASMSDEPIFDYSSPALESPYLTSSADYDKLTGENPWESPGRGGTATFLPGPLLHAANNAADRNNNDPTPTIPIPIPVQPTPASKIVSAPDTLTNRIPSSRVPGRFPGGVHRPTLSKLPTYRPPPPASHKKLSEWFATAICGNDITSSCLYVTGIVMAEAGIFTPISLILVALTLYLFRNIYGESVTALPLNGGAYNVLLNTTSKSTAAMAACLTILSYVATCVVSGSDAISYLRYLWPSLEQELGTVLLICLFAFLNLMGMTESAVVAFVIFTFHIFCLSVFVVVAIVYLCSHSEETADVFNYNWKCQFGEIECDFKHSIPSSLVFGFSQAMLGVSGFESSANFVEEQAEGVFVKTLRNMWALVAFFNPAIAFLAVFLMKIDDVAKYHTSDLLAAMAAKVGSNWGFDYLISANAFLVLSGSVLTSYVGVVGLCRRLSLDRCMPQFLLVQNSWRKTNHTIILGFAGVTISMYMILNGNIQSLANVYSVSFLSVMSLFAIGNMLLKYKRAFLHRQVVASWSSVVLALALVLFALAGVLAGDSSILLVWAIYFCCTGLVIMIMFFRMQSLKLLYHAIKYVSKRLGIRHPPGLKLISATIEAISSQAVVFFVKHGALSVMNKAVQYVRQNEDCAHIRVVHVFDQEELIPMKLQRNVSILDEEYPKVKIDLVLVRGSFGPETVDYVSQTLKVPKNLMFITSPKADFVHKLESLGGVRLITH